MKIAQHSILTVVLFAAFVAPPSVHAFQSPAGQDDSHAAAAADKEALQACIAGADKNMTMLPTRMPDIPIDKLTPAQKDVAFSEFGTQRQTRAPGVVGGPYLALLRSPEVLRYMKQLNVYLQERSAVPMKLRQFIIMITARQMSTQYTFHVHCPQAVKAGISLETAKAISEGRRPPSMAEDEAIVYDFLDELHRNQSVSDVTYARALNKFGEQGVIDITSINGFYTSFLMVANVARTSWHLNTPSLATFPR